MRKAFAVYCTVFLIFSLALMFNPNSGLDTWERIAWVGRLFLLMPLISFITACYFLPTLICWLKCPSQKYLIFCVNLCICWTGIGWLCLMGWILASPEEPLT